jgi:uncharacterized protein (TIGR00369 family)
MTYKKIPNSDTHNCFACSPKNPYGLHMELLSDDISVMSRILIPEHFAGWGRVVHGGILATILDEIMGWSGIYLLKQFTLTKNMNIEYIKAAFIGDTLQAVGRVKGTDGKRNAEIEGLVTNGSGDVCARSKAEFTTLSPRLAIRLGLVTEAQMQNYFIPLFNRRNPEAS